MGVPSDSSLWLLVPGRCLVARQSVMRTTAAWWDPDWRATSGALCKHEVVIYATSEDEDMYLEIHVHAECWPQKSLT